MIMTMYKNFTKQESLIDARYHVPTSYPRQQACNVFIYSQYIIGCKGSKKK